MLAVNSAAPTPAATLRSGSISENACADIASHHERIFTGSGRVATSRNNSAAVACNVLASTPRRSVALAPSSARSSSWSAASSWHCSAIITRSNESRSIATVAPFAPNSSSIIPELSQR
ncbi:MAG: hypothetical protein U0269_08665 [Polyangiales bacterium]